MVVRYNLDVPCRGRQARLVRVSDGKPNVNYFVVMFECKHIAQYKHMQLDVVTHTCSKCNQSVGCGKALCHLNQPSIMINRSILPSSSQ